MKSVALVYEHWRPDTNECFYVGASRKGEEIRAANFYRENDSYKQIIAELSEKNLTPFYKIIWNDLEDDCVGAHEKMRIAYQKAILGEKLTNVAKGGDGFWIDWTDELRRIASKRTTQFYQSPQGNQCRQQISQTLINFVSTEEGKKWCELQKQIKYDFFSSLAGDLWREEASKRREDFLDSPEGKIWRQNRSNQWTEFLSSERAIDWRENQSNCIKDALKKPSARWNMMLRDWHRSNVRPRFYWGA